MSQKDFAQKCGISDATLSQVFSGKTGATQKTVQKVLSAFPSVSLAWLMYGQGRMYENGAADFLPSQQEGANLREQFSSDKSFSQDAGIPMHVSSDLGSFLPEFAKEEPAAVSSGSGPEQSFSSSRSPSSDCGTPIRSRNSSSGLPSPGRQMETVKFFDKPERRIKEIRIFFDDGTYEIFVPQGK